ncbi:MAG: 23S rRNA (pseudouridine1915-N3)-methyltransferase [Bacteroidetes bacterium]|jgi:23S rRNA (pseudouridine1915-N3)-methyltransferase|nr:MAG: 23S rRNA (pseudouridine1915-N3)-methyltransferase [Bacteroidota bacterium]
MKILLLAVGKTDEKYLEEGMKKYHDRIVHYLPFELKIVPDLKNRKSLSMDQQKQMEGEVILEQLQAGDELVLLDENGKHFSSRSFSVFLERKMITGPKRLVFVIGGPYGFSTAVYERASSKISLSSMTFSHQMVRLIFLEQVYRALSITKGEPYHHD